MATADVDEKTGRESQEVAPAIESGLVWDESVRHRPIGLGWDSQAVVVAREGDPGPAALLIVANDGRSARLNQPVTEGDLPRPYDSGTPVEGLGGLRCLCDLPGGSESVFELIGLAGDGLVLPPNRGSFEAPSFPDRQPLGLPVDLGLEGCRVAQLAAVDWDGDGQVDLLVGLPADSARFVLPALTGRATPEHGDWSTVLLLENQGKHGLIPRPISTLDGRPLVVGVEGCSPSGVPGAEPGRLDLLVGSDDGHVHYFRRDQLRW